MHSRHSGAQDVEAVKIISYCHHDCHHLPYSPHAKEATDRDSSDNALAMCQSNYTGTMCMDCAETFYATGNRCEKCVDAEIPHAVLLLLVATWRTSFQAQVLVLACQGSLCSGRWPCSPVHPESDGLGCRGDSLPSQHLAAATQSTGAAASADVSPGCERMLRLMAVAVNRSMAQVH